MSDGAGPSNTWALLESELIGGDDGDDDKNDNDTDGRELSTKELYVRFAIALAGICWMVYWVARSVEVMVT